MSTNCSVSILIDGQVKSVYGHWDGCPSDVGRKLTENYKTRDIVAELIELGDFSQLEETLDASVFYARDKGEDPSRVRSLTTNIRTLNKTYSSAEYHYFFVDQEGWFVRASRDEKWQRLDEKMLSH